jgi:hypothetical protein
MDGTRGRKYDRDDVVGDLQADNARRRLRHIRWARVARQTLEEE